MGYIIYNNSATKAPEYSCSVEGTPAWAGVEQSQFTPALEKDLRPTMLVFLCMPE